MQQYLDGNFGFVFHVTLCLMKVDGMLCLFLFTYIMVWLLGLHFHERHPHGFKASWECLPQQKVIC